MSASCALCNQPTQKFAESHIIPRWMYEWMCEQLPENGREMKIISAYPNEYEKRSRIGVYDDFVCAGCEGIFQKWDDYAAKILRDPPTPTPDGEGWSFGDYDYEKLKLFFLSVLWRMHACKHDFFSHMNIDRVAHLLGQRLLNNSLAADDELTVMVLYWKHKLAHGLLPSESLLLSSSTMAWTLYLPFFQVLVWEGFQEPSEDYEPYVLKPGQPLFMIEKKITEHEINTVKNIALKNLEKKQAYKARR